MKLEKMQPGMKLYDRRKHRMGNTKVMTIGEWPVVIVSVDIPGQCVVAKWNYNPERCYYRKEAEKWSAWSMFDKDVEVTRGMCEQVTKVVRRKKT